MVIKYKSANLPKIKPKFVIKTREQLNYSRVHVTLSFQLTEKFQIKIKYTVLERKIEKEVNHELNMVNVYAQCFICIVRYVLTYNVWKIYLFF